jgi:photosystem I reaction center subunit VIII
MTTFNNLPSIFVPLVGLVFPAIAIETMEYRKIKDEDDHDVASDIESVKGKSHTGEIFFSQIPLLVFFNVLIGALI